MLYNLYSVRDKIVNAYNAPTLFVNEEAAKRSFRALLQKRPDIAEDLSLWNLGTFEDETGTIIPNMPKMVEM